MHASRVVPRERVEEIKQWVDGMIFGAGTDGFGCRGGLDLNAVFLKPTGRADIVYFGPGAVAGAGSAPGWGLIDKDLLRESVPDQDIFPLRSQF